MNDNKILGVGKVASAIFEVLGYYDQKTGGPTAAQSRTKSTGLRKAAGAEKSAKDSPEAAEHSIPGNPKDITLRFKISPEDHDVTVLILNKNTQEVIRTIPPEELKNLSRGELFELFV